MYYIQRGNKLIILLVGDGKTRLQKDIDKAKKLARAALSGGHQQREY